MNDSTTGSSPPVREMLVAKIDELVGMTSRDLDEIRAVTDQLEPDRAQSCRVVLTMAKVILDEVQLRAPRPLTGRGGTVNDELPTVHCPACGGHTLRPSDSLAEEIERRVIGDAERWACACGYIEDRPAPTDMIP